MWCLLKQLGLLMVPFRFALRGGLVVRASGSQAKHDGFESWSRHVIFLGKEFTHICSGQVSLLPVGWKMSTSFCWGLNPVVHLWGWRVICGAACGAVNTTYASTACQLPTVRMSCNSLRTKCTLNIRGLT